MKRSRKSVGTAKSDFHSLYIDPHAFSHLSDLPLVPFSMYQTLPLGTDALLMPLKCVEMKV